MTAGYRAVQSTHAAINFIFEHPGRAGPWFHLSNYLVMLEVDDETQLEKLIKTVQKQKLSHTVFREPDIGNVITAIAIEPSPITQKVVRKLPLLFKDKTNNNVKGNKNPSYESKGVQPDKNHIIQTQH